MYLVIVFFVLEDSNANWQEWIRSNLKRGCKPEELMRIAKQAGVSDTILKQAFENPYTSSGHMLTKEPVLRPVFDQNQKFVLSPSPLDWYNLDITKNSHLPRAWKLDTPLAQIFEIPDFISREESQKVIDIIESNLKPSTVAEGDADYRSSSYRTSMTSHLNTTSCDILQSIDARIGELLGVDLRFSEPIQGQRYEAGQFFKEHTDFFDPGTKNNELHTSDGGQRTWTVMIYLNSQIHGGQTCFKKVGRKYVPITRMTLAWNNLMADGSPNYNTYMSITSN